MNDTYEQHYVGRKTTSDPQKKKGGQEKRGGTVGDRRLKSKKVMEERKIKECRNCGRKEKNKN